MHEGSQPQENWTWVALQKESARSLFVKVLAVWLWCHIVVPVVHNVIDYDFFET